MLVESGIVAEVVPSVPVLVSKLEEGAGFGVVAEEAIGDSDLNALSAWIEKQPKWSDFPFVLLTRRGGGLERNPTASRFLDVLGNVTFLERPFHPTSLISLAKSALRVRHRQYDARARLEELDRLAADLRGSSSLETKVHDRTRDLAKANDRLTAEIAERERAGGAPHSGTEDGGGGSAHGRTCARFQQFADGGGGVARPASSPDG